MIDNTSRRLIGRFTNSLHEVARHPTEEAELSAYEVGWELAQLVARLAKGSPQDIAQAQSISLQLGRIYKDGDESGRRLLLNSVVEHVLEFDESQAIFESWLLDEGLAAALSDANDWASYIRGTIRILFCVACEVQAILSSVGKPVPRVQDRTMGTNVVVLLWHKQPLVQGVQSLTLEPGLRMSKAAQDHIVLSEQTIEKLALFALDFNNWRRSEYLKDDRSVTLESTNPPSLRRKCSAELL